MFETCMTASSADLVPVAPGQINLPDFGNSSGVQVLFVPGTCNAIPGNFVELDAHQSFFTFALTGLCRDPVKTVFGHDTAATHGHIVFFDVKYSHH